jgi:hypothetical protein
VCWFVSQPVVHACLTRALFPIVAKEIFAQLMSAVQYVLLYGRRSIQEEQVTGETTVHGAGVRASAHGVARPHGDSSHLLDFCPGIVRSDIASLRETFSKVVPASDLSLAMAEIQQLCEVMELPTDELIGLYNRQQSPLPFPIMARIIAARSGKNAQKLIDKIRGK